MFHIILIFIPLIKQNYIILEFAKKRKSSIIEQLFKNSQKDYENSRKNRNGEQKKFAFQKWEKEEIFS